MSRHRIVIASLIAAVAAVAVTATACSSGTAGSGRAAAGSAGTSGPAPTVTVTRTAATVTSAPSASASTSISSSSSAAPTGGSGGDPTLTQPAQLRCSGSTERVTDCLSNSLAAYWFDHAPDNQQVNQIVLLQIPIDPADDPCTKAAHTAEGPFTCTSDAGELYLPPSFQKKLSSWFSPADLPYAYASILSHEYGHYLQLDVRDPNIGNQHRTQQQSQALEQQADCLSGVWAHDAATNHGYDAGRFNAVAMDLIRRVSSDSEIYSHGTPDQRFAALDKGLGTGRPSACGLAGLH